MKKHNAKIIITRKRLNCGDEFDYEIVYGLPHDGEAEREFAETFISQEEGLIEFCENEDRFCAKEDIPLKYEIEGTWYEEGFFEPFLKHDAKALIATGVSMVAYELLNLKHLP